jgi:hypothetical protein
MAPFIWDSLPDKGRWAGTYVQNQSESGVVFDVSGNAYAAIDGESAGKVPSGQLLLVLPLGAAKWNVFSFSDLGYSGLRLESYVGNNEVLAVPVILGASHRFQDVYENEDHWPRRIRVVIGKWSASSISWPGSDQAPLVPPVAPEPGKGSENLSHVLSLGDDFGNATITWKGKVYIVWTYPGLAGTQQVHAACKAFDLSTGSFVAPANYSSWFATIDSGRPLSDDPTNQYSYPEDGIPWADPHCFPVLAIDTKGVLHCVVGGHNTKVTYLCTTEPEDLSHWEDRSSQLKDIGGEELSGTYPSLVCDHNNVLHLVIRRSGNPYALAYLRGKIANNGATSWETKYLVRCPEPLYANFKHRLSINYAGHLFVSFTIVRQDVAFSYPSLLLVSDDGGDHWHLCREDFFS